MKEYKFIFSEDFARNSGIKEVIVWEEFLVTAISRVAGFVNLSSAALSLLISDKSVSVETFGI